MARKRTDSTAALRTTIALRLYLSAQTPQNGTRGSPKKSAAAESRPTVVATSASGTPRSRTRRGRKLTKCPKPTVSMKPAVAKTRASRGAAPAPRGRRVLVEAVKTPAAALLVGRPDASIGRPADVVDGHLLPRGEMRDVVEETPVGATGLRLGDRLEPRGVVEPLPDGREPRPHGCFVGPEVALGLAPTARLAQLLDRGAPDVHAGQIAHALSEPGCRDRPWRPRAACPAPRCAGRRPRRPPRGPCAGGPIPARGAPPRSCRRAR